MLAWNDRTRGNLWRSSPSLTVMMTLLLSQLKLISGCPSVMTVTPVAQGAVTLSASPGGAYLVGPGGSAVSLELNWERVVNILTKEVVRRTKQYVVHHPAPCGMAVMSIWIVRRQDKGNTGKDGSVTGNRTRVTWVRARYPNH